MKGSQYQEQIQCKSTTNIQLFRHRGSKALNSNPMIPREPEHRSSAFLKLILLSPTQSTPSLSSLGMLPGESGRLERFQKTAHSSEKNVNLFSRVPGVGASIILMSLAMGQSPPSYPHRGLSHTVSHIESPGTT